jgi:hypothetical protein
MQPVAVCAVASALLTISHPCAARDAQRGGAASILARSRARGDAAAAGAGDAAGGATTSALGASATGERRNPTPCSLTPLRSSETLVETPCSCLEPLSMSCPWSLSPILLVAHHNASVSAPRTTINVATVGSSHLTVMYQREAHRHASRDAARSPGLPRAQRCRSFKALHRARWRSTRSRVGLALLEERRQQSCSTLVRVLRLHSCVCLHVAASTATTTTTIATTIATAATTHTPNTHTHTHTHTHKQTHTHTHNALHTPVATRVVC